MTTWRLASRTAILGLVCAAALAVLAPAASAATFTGGPITINDSPDCAQGVATPYPSTITVPSTAGTITDVNVTLTNFSHEFTSDVRMLLVGPAGQKVLLMNAATDEQDATNLTFTLDDEAAGPIPDEIVNASSYKPTQFDGCDPAQHSLIPPAPASPYGTALSGFDGTNPTGTWSLYVVDEIDEGSGAIGGWTLNMTTTTGPVTASNNAGITINDRSVCGVPQTPATPYPSPVVVSGLTSPITDVNVTLTNLTHEFSYDVRALLVGPSGQTTLLMHEAGGTFPDDAEVTDQTVTFDDAAPNFLPARIVSGTYKPTQAENACANVSAATSLPAPAPAGPYGSTLADFNGTNPNGTWKLYVIDDIKNGDGDIGGWSLDITTAASYSSEVLGENPGGYWRFGEPSGTLLTDSSGHANNGTYLGGVTLGAPGALNVDPNTAASYDGVNDTGRVPDANSLDVGSSFTMEGWIKRSSTAKSQELFNKGQNGLQLTVMSAASGNKVWLRKAGVTTIAQSTTGVPADGAYHYVAATMNGTGSTARIYVDGTDVTQVLPAGGVQSIANTTFALTFGGAGSAQAFYDEFALYDEALPSCEIGDHYTTATGGPYIGC
jgi:subtilisin-like proprotein convertase family protein